MPNELQAMRKRAGYKSAKLFAEAIGMSADTYTNYEQGKSKLSLEKGLFGGFCGRDSGIGPAQRAKTTIWN